MFIKLKNIKVVDLFSATGYHISDVATSSENVSCTLATPELDYTVDGITVKDDLGLDSVLGSVWIGYYSAYHSFQYYGKMPTQPLWPPTRLGWLKMC